jgi:hypothetical protein
VVDSTAPHLKSYYSIEAVFRAHLGVAALGVNKEWNLGAVCAVDLLGERFSRT